MSNNVISGAYNASYLYQNTTATVTDKEKGTEASVSSIYEALDVSASVSLDLSSTAVGTGTEAAKVSGDGKYTMDIDKVNAMKADFGRNLDAFKQMVTKLFDTQGGVGNVAMDNIHSIITRITQAGGIDQLSQQQAQEMISEDGYWGVEQTATRILDFAKALTGGDPSKIDTMQKAYQKGFDEAERLWGGKLPEISYQTHEKVLEGFEEWAGQKTVAETQTEKE